MSTQPEQDSSPGLMDRAKALVARVMRTRPYRANERLGQSRGAILSAGIAFYGVFSVFPLLVLGFTAMGLIIGGNEELQEQIIDYVQGLLPGVVGDPGDGAIVAPETLLAQATDTTTLGITALIGVVTLLWTGLGWISSLREGIRGVFRMPTLQLDIVRAKLFDLAVLLSLGTLIVVTSLANVATSTVTEQLLDVLGLERTTLGRVLTVAVVGLGTLLLNTLLIAVLYRVLALATAPYRTVIGGAFVAALGVAVLQQLVGLVLGNVGGNFGFLQAFVPILTLFVWLNLTARVMLFGASWVAVGADPAPAQEPVTVPAVVDPRASMPQLPPVLPVRWTDRAMLGAGVVLGAAGLGLVQVSASAVKALGAGVRGLVRDDD